MYVDDNKPCHAALFISDDSKISPSHNGRGYLIDEGNHLIDPASFADYRTVKIDGIAGFMLVTDAKGAPVTIQKRVLINENGLMESMVAPDEKAGIATPPKGNWGKEIPAIRITTATRSTGEKINLRLAVPEPTTRP